MEQRNQFVFELGMRRRLADGSYASRTLAIHALAVAPDTIRSVDASRSARDQTAMTSMVTRGGRALKNWSLTGTFGVEVRGAGSSLGTGEQRRRRFHEEVIRLPDAVTTEQIAAYQRAPDKTPGVSEALQLLNLDQGDALFVNVYNFWDGVAFEGLVRSITQTRSASRAAASGVSWYDMTIEEIGPVVQDGIGAVLLSAAVSGMAVWQSYNDTIRSYNVDDLTDALIGAGAATALAELTTALETVRAQLDGVTALARGGPRSQVATTFWLAAQSLEAAATRVAGLVRSPELRPASAGWANFHEGDLTARRYRQRVDLFELAFSARYQRIAGVFFGLDVEAWRALLAGSQNPRLAQGARPYVVADGETGASIEASTGINWAAILSSNRLLPQDVTPGTVLLIPGSADTAPQPIPGLPTFGSHGGPAAWGSDVTPDLAVRDGDLVVVDGEAVLVQGMMVLMAEYGEQVMEGVDAMEPDYRPEYVVERLREILASDQRIAAVADVVATFGADGGLDVGAKVLPINGSTLRIGG